MKKKNLPLLLFILLSSGSSLISQTYTFDFSYGDELFTGGVSDFAVIQSGQHHFTFDNRYFQPPLDTTRLAQYVSGNNPSDDLFMYMKRKITGLDPNTTYRVSFIVDFASIYPTNAIGIGGAPGESVTMKAGVTLIEPDTMIENKGGDYVVMNIDKGNQSNPGQDMDTIGHVGVSDTTTVYTFKTNDNISHPFVFTTDQSGEAWIIVGTDSGFEGETSLYYASITVDFTETTAVEPTLSDREVNVFPNPSSGAVYVSSSGADFDMIRIYDISGRLFRSYITKTSDVAFYLPRSDYLLKITSGNSTVVKRVIVE
jgi:hypothetical protein